MERETGRKPRVRSMSYLLSETKTLETAFFSPGQEWMDIFLPEVQWSGSGARGEGDDDAYSHFFSVPSLLTVEAE